VGLTLAHPLIARRGSSYWIIIVKTVLNNLWAHIGHEEDGHLVHADKRTGMQFVSVKTWPNLVAARQALDIGFSKIKWEELKEPPPPAA
jgi:hypothetical protein